MEPPKGNPTRDEAIEQKFDEEISDKEVKEAIRKLKPRKAVGEDEIPNEFITKGGPILQKALTRIFKAIQSEEWIPPDWTQERVKLLHKGKSKTNLDNYRGIAITSNVGKVFTRIWAERLGQVVEDNNMLGEIQGGFRKNRSTTDNLFILTTMIDREPTRPKIQNYTWHSST